MRPRARRRTRWVGRFAFALLVSSTLWVGARQLPRALAHMELFGLSNFEVTGTRYLTGVEAAEIAGITAESSLWDDREAWEERLRAYPLVENVRVRRRPPSTLRFEIVENKPVAFVSAATLEPIGTDGRLLPIDPSVHRLDLPVLRASLDPSDPQFASSGALRVLLGELARLESVDSEFRERISEAWLTERGEVGIRLVAPDVTFYWRAPVSARRLSEGMAALTHAFEPGSRPDPTEVDLRFADQVVVRFGRQRR
ncbi:MAG: FtsQ-type POTRA domain-containing protein [Gemmatimonadota bacterium]